MDNIIYDQMKKVESKAQFIRQFWQAFEMEKSDIQRVREEVISERVALTVLRSGDVKGSQTEKVLNGNELSSMNSTMRKIMENNSNE